MKTYTTILHCFALTLFLSIEAVSQQAAQGTQSFTVNVKGVGCKEDVKSIAASIEKLDGVVKCNPLKRGATTKFQVDYDPDKVSKNQIFVAVEDTPGCQNPKKRPYKVKNKE